MWYSVTLLLLPLTLALPPITPSVRCGVLQGILTSLVHSSDRCLFLSTDHSECPLAPTDHPVLSVALDRVFSGLLLRHQRLLPCRRVLVLLDHFSTLALATRHRHLREALQPHTQLLVFSLAQEPFEGALSGQFLQGVLQHGLFLRLGRLLNGTHFQLQDALRNETSTHAGTAQGPLPGDQFHRHPLFSGSGPEFNVSLFHCPPHVIRLDERNTLDSYEGAEFRFLREMTRGWRVNLFDRTFLSDRGSPWVAVAEDVSTGRTMMGMCSTWLSWEKYQPMALSTTFSHLCGTFLVPRPTEITRASYIYLPLAGPVWLVVTCTLCATALLYALLLWLPARGGGRQQLSRAFLDVVNIFTAHGLPRVVQRVPVRLLIMSWVLLSLLLNTAYSTKYTSILTQPRYTRAVDNLQDFIDVGLSWGEVGDRSDWKAKYLTSGDPLLEQLAQRMREERDLLERLQHIPSGRYARYVKVLGNNYVTDTETFAPVAHHLRLMRSCVDRYYSVFPFNRNSPYTEWANRRLGLLRDAGIVSHWFSLMSIRHAKAYMAGLFDKHQARRRSERTALELANVSGAFYLLGSGLLLSTLVFCLELCVQRKRGSARHGDTPPSRVGAKRKRHPPAAE